MLHYNTVDVSEVINVNKASASKECISYHYCYFCTKVSGFSQLSIDIKNIAILNINEVNYHCIIFGMSENGTMNLPKNANLSKKSGPL